MPHGEHAGGGSTPGLQTANDGTGAHRGVLPDAMADDGAARGEARTVVPAAESKAVGRPYARHAKVPHGTSTFNLPPTPRGTQLSWCRRCGGSADPRHQLRRDAHELRDDQGDHRAPRRRLAAGLQAGGNARPDGTPPRDGTEGDRQRNGGGDNADGAVLQALRPFHRRMGKAVDGHPRG